MIADMKEIEAAAAEVSRARETLENLLANAEAEVLEVKRRHRAGIKRAAGVLQRRMEFLLDLAKDAPELFRRPRSVTMYSVKVGWQTPKPALEIPDPAKTVGLIESRYPSMAEDWIRTTKAPDKAALLKADAKVLARVAVTRPEQKDQAFVRLMSGDIEKAVQALFQGMADETETATQEKAAA